MKKGLAFLLVLVVFTFGCTTTQNNDSESDGNQVPIYTTDSESERSIATPGSTQSEPGDNPTEQPPEALPLLDGSEEPFEPGPSEPPAEGPATPPVPPEPVVKLKVFRIDSDDDDFYDEEGNVLKDLELEKGDEVTITFFIRKTGTYFGGMTIRGPDFDSGKLDKEEEYIVTFTADESHQIKSYWPATNKLKAKLNINVN